MMEKHFVRQSKTISEQEFRRFVSAAKLFPGPTATLISIRIGNHLRGKIGGLIAGIGLIFPAFLMMLFLASLFHESKNLSLPWIHALINGLNWGGLAIAVITAFHFAKPLLQGQSLYYLLISAVLTFFYPRHEIYFLIGCGTLSLLSNLLRGRILETGAGILFLLFYESFKSSLFTFGTGIAIVPALKAVYLDHYHWVNPEEFLTALSFGQMTPGPLVIFNTFLGHQTAGIGGALFSTFGTFLPTFIFGLFLMPLIERKLIDSPKLKYFFAGMIPAVGGAIFGSVLRLCWFALGMENNSASIFSTIIFLTLLIFAWLKASLHPTIILLLGGLLSVLVSLFGINR
jgi:chromate transporter